MKNTLFLIITASLFIFSCKKDPASNTQKENGSLNYNQSYSAWLSYKNNVHNSYVYTTAYGSFTGNVLEEKVTVTNGTVVAFDYTLKRMDNAIINQYHEDKASLGTHDNAVLLLTLDDVYTKAKNVWLKADPKSNSIYFETKNNGLISNCGYVPNNCADDCFTGITITSITAQ